MATKTLVHVMRHGEVFNPEKVLYGRLPGYKLSALGLQMAERAAQYFKNNNLSLIVSSPLERAQQTAAPTANLHYKKVAQRMRSAIFAAKDLTKGQEALLVSHQLPIWIARLSAEGKSFIHDPRKRQCSLASVTTFVFENDSLVAVEYEEPAADLLKDASKISGA
jgi:broad specificity phosphatase PhoE